MFFALTRKISFVIRISFVILLTRVLWFDVFGLLLLYIICLLLVDFFSIFGFFGVNILFHSIEIGLINFDISIRNYIVLFALAFPFCLIYLSEISLRNLPEIFVLFEVVFSEWTVSPLQQLEHGRFDLSFLIWFAKSCCLLY